MTCRICTANDEEALIEQMAEAMWMTQSSTDPDDEWQPRERAGPYWHRIMRQFAAASLGVLRRDFAGI
ncbi:hypothetical protein [Novosphingobium gossypii]|uniref:hypothetical protein n=1 Tax=Novosphingobium gossypii TaxID=1604774 RepID=UPI003D2344CE